MGNRTGSVPDLIYDSKRKKSLSEGDLDIGASRHVIETSSMKKRKNLKGEKMINDYIIKEELGSGSFGKVKLGIHDASGAKVAIKILKKSFLKHKRVGRIENALDSVKREVAVMKKIDHPNIVNLIEMIDDPAAEKLYLVMELVPGGPIIQGSNKLADLIPLPIEICRKYFRDIILGLDYLHKHNIVHRDIKPENLLVGEDGHVKIADFGVSYLFNEGDDFLRKTAGTPAFLAPEVCTGETYHAVPTDIWSLGITLYLIVFGKCPFLARNVMMMYKAIKENPLVFPTKVDPQLEDLFHRILERDTNKRITLKELKIHPWVTENGKINLSIRNDAHSLVTVDAHDVRYALSHCFKISTLTNVKMHAKRWSNYVKQNKSVIGIFDNEKIKKDNSNIVTNINSNTSLPIHVNIDES